MKKLAISIIAICIIGIIEIFAIVYGIDGGGLAASIGAIAAIATWRAVKYQEGKQPPPQK